ncbi:hypothetical protein VTH82DRAFT_7112 [Thermothelomyces myriococcoides]
MSPEPLTGEESLRTMKNLAAAGRSITFRSYRPQFPDDTIDVFAQHWLSYKSV